MSTVLAIAGEAVYLACEVNDLHRSKLPADLSTTPDAVAHVVLDGLDKSADIVWAPRALRWLMIAVRMLPRPLFRRLRQ